MEIKIVSDPQCWEYCQPYHPESPDRVEKSYEYLQSQGFDIIEPHICPRADLLLAHTKSIVDAIEQGDFYDPDTPNLPKIYDYALLSTSSAIDAMKTTLDNCMGFSLMRPPGHHAGKNFLGGFCYFNNIAIATKKYFELNPNNKVAILDIDCHHGNGTQDIFLGDENVLYISLHQVPLYPGTGLKSEQNCLNFPIPPGTNDTQYLHTLENTIIKIVEFKPQILGISAGFDTYKNDPIANIKLTQTCYKNIGQMIIQTKIPIFVTLEGGYSPDLPILVYNFCQGLLT